MESHAAIQWASLRQHAGRGGDACVRWLSGGPRCGNAWGAGPPRPHPPHIPFRPHLEHEPQVVVHAGGEVRRRQCAFEHHLAVAVIDNGELEPLAAQIRLAYAHLGKGVCVGVCNVWGCAMCGCAKSVWCVNKVLALAPVLQTYWHQAPQANHRYLRMGGCRRPHPGANGHTYARDTHVTRT
eukprot:351866-Chlamydomonas_euryale.AAC.2